MTESPKKSGHGGRRDGAGRKPEGRKKYSMKYREELIERIDAIRGEEPRTRWIEDAIEKKLDALDSSDP